MNDKEYFMFYSALQWMEANEIQSELSEGKVPKVTSRMAIGDEEKLSRARDLVDALRSQACRWDGLVLFAARE